MYIILITFIYKEAQIISHRDFKNVKRLGRCKYPLVRNHEKFEVKGADQK